MSLRPFLLPLCLAALTLSACGEDDPRVTTPPAQTAAGTYSLTEAENRLEATALDLQRDSADSALADGLDPEPRTVQAYRSQDNALLTLFVFATPADAERAVPRLAEKEPIKEGGAFTTAGNLILAVNGGPRDRDAYEAAFAIFRRIGDPTQDEELDTSGVLTATELAEEGNAALGRKVTVRGPAGAVLPAGGPASALYLGGSTPGKRLLVVPEKADGIPAQLAAEPLPGADRPIVEVTGTVRRVSELGEYAEEGDRGFLAALTATPALVAERITIVRGG
ncbi:MAG: hypothetical protein H0V81_06840 [Solirubrobacterales bacterium]|nr:hypothetical protein [Solirubrobacterales bacterium]